MAETPQVRLRRVKALSEEVDAASSLFRHGFNILRQYKFAVLDADPLFVCLAGGAEKLLKLTLGLHGLEVDGAWPPAAKMRKAGHGITELYGDVRVLTETRRSLSTAPGYIQQLLDQVAADPYIPQVLTTLERYAVRGRFYNLDFLGDQPQPEPSPAQLWEDLHQTLLRLRPDLLAKLPTDQWEVGRQEINQIIEGSIRLWCELIARSWRTGIFGVQAQQWSVQLGLDQRLLRSGQ